MSLFVKAHGGLGNQLFQAQYAHFIAEIIPELSVHFRTTHSNDSRDFQLEGFFDNCPHVTQRKSRYQLESSKNLILNGMLRRNLTFVEFFIKRLEDDKARSIEDLKKFVKFGSSASIRGYFQDRIFEASDCFFRALKEAIAKEPVLDMIEYRTVIHIRKGDFKKFRSHGPLSNEYFESLFTNFASGFSVLHTDAESSQLSAKIVNRINEVKFSSNNSPWSLLRDSIGAQVFIGSNSTLSWWAATVNEKLNSGEPAKILFPSDWKRENCDAREKLIKSNWEIFQSDWES
jgi:hypothetical protein